MFFAGIEPVSKSLERIPVLHLPTLDHIVRTIPLFGLLSQRGKANCERNRAFVLTSNGVEQYQ